jgi:hypothetical protein
LNEGDDTHLCFAFGALMMVGKEARRYVGAGSNQRLFEDALKEQVASSCGVGA